MRNVEKQKEKYKSRIKRFIQNLTKIDPLWTTKRSWFEDLKNFELGDNFWSKVLVADDSSPKDKGDFYTGVFIYVNIDFQARCGNKNEQLESGFEIEPDIDNDFEKEEHESLLGYLWWLEIYKEAHKAKRFSAAEELQLQKKRRALYKSKK